MSHDPSNDPSPLDPHQYMPSAPAGSPVGSTSTSTFSSTPLSSYPTLQQHIDPSILRLEKLRQLAGRYEIRPDFVAKLRELESYTVVMVCDDSGSMNTPVQPGPGAPKYDPYSATRPPTRWDELCRTTSAVVELASCLTDSISIFFLNRPPLMNVTSAEQVQTAFRYAPPAGFTPLTRVVGTILSANAQLLAEKRMLLIIATDGEPTTDTGTVDVNGFLRLLQQKPNNVYVQIMACTDDDRAVGWLNAADNTIPKVDVTDDYYSEREEILKAQGQSFHFSFGDYVCKALLGPIDPYFDSLDEVRGGGHNSGGMVCSIS
jgi:hypothetical protein